MVMLTKKDSLTKTSNGSSTGGIFIQKSPLKTSKNTKRNIKTPKKKKLNCSMLIRNTRLIFSSWRSTDSWSFGNKFGWA